MMQAAVVRRYGPAETVKIERVPRPEPGAGEIRVRVRAAAVTSGDARIRGARFPRGLGIFARLGLGLRGPRRPVLGMAFSGEVDALGPDTRAIPLGTAVCGMAGAGMGAHAEYLVLSESRAVPKPAEIAHIDAAAMVFGGTTALFFLRDSANVVAGQSVLVNGASGAVGTNAVQIARHLGARVTGVTSGTNLDLVSSLGAETVFDYRTTPVADIGKRFDIVFDTVGNISPKSGRALLNDGGTVLLAAAGLGDMLRSRGNVKTGQAPERAADIATLLEMMRDGRLRAVVEAALPLNEIAAAYRRVDSGRKVGNIVVEP